jgi:hypothetical protein
MHDRIEHLFGNIKQEFDKLAGCPPAHRLQYRCWPAAKDCRNLGQRVGK